MEKFLYSAKNISYDLNTFVLEYYVLKKSNNCETMYGIEVIKIREIDSIVYSESKKIANITPSESVIISMIDIISNNTVTPITLIDVIEDLSDEQCNILEDQNVS